MKSNHKNFIRRLQKQKEDALEFIVDTYLPLIKGITYKVLSPLGNEGIVDECINDIFLSVWENADKFRGDTTDFRKWICAVAKFKSIDYYRKAMKQVEITSEHMEWNAAISVEEELIRIEDKTELIMLVNQLEPVDRDIFLMKFFLGYKTADISKKTGLSITAIDNRVFRGKKKLSKEAMDLNPGGFVL
ncbi:sigma-70 family RNA polymerase sigma factor [Sporosarcina sp. Sa2YVA2]|uniref:Sigma-70 family RNA polymerase sigma factor n=1 Tax=Sporosarcina quadrami TaxID=2762234 RepID=A0ABR8UBT8_9BACL|nr:sigma-70 family RNA polymerase sigma factor [Sporosarcina quadrami]MBD7985491.1 sigma-70 family RNA polymerase sigma factor [Sporosarcina quadrami]